MVTKTCMTQTRMWLKWAWSYKGVYCNSNNIRIIIIKILLLLFEIVFVASY